MIIKSTMPTNVELLNVTSFALVYNDLRYIVSFYSGENTTTPIANITVENFSDLPERVKDRVMAQWFEINRDATSRTINRMLI